MTKYLGTCLLVSWALAASAQHPYKSGTSKKNELVPLVTGQKVLEDVVYMNSNSTVYWARLDAEKRIVFKTFAIRLTFIYVKQGSLVVNGVALATNDQARLTAEEVVEISATKDAEFILIDLPGSEANY